MQDDAGWAELERLAQAAGAADAQLASEYPSNKTIERWQHLFGYTSEEAVQLITAQRSDITRERLTDSHWNLIKVEKEAAGHDWESYEHSLQLKNVFKAQSASVAHPDGSLMLLFRLGGLLRTPEKVKEVAGLEDTPVVQDGWSERGRVRFVVVDEDAKMKLEEWLTQQSVL